MNKTPELVLKQSGDESEEPPVRERGREPGELMRRKRELGRRLIERQVHLADGTVCYTPHARATDGLGTGTG